MRYVPLIGRILYSLIFIMSGLNHFMKHSTMTSYASSQGVPAAGVAVIITGLMILAGGLSILLGFKPKIGSLLLFIFLIPTAFIMHKFWGISNAMQAQSQMVHFMKNISMAGAALIFYYFGTGPISMEKTGE